MTTKSNAKSQLNLGISKTSEISEQQTVDTNNCEINENIIYNLGDTNNNFDGEIEYAPLSQQDIDYIDSCQNQGVAFDDYYQDNTNISNNDNLQEIKSFQSVKIDDIFSVHPRKLWGNLLLRLRQKNYMTLHSACAEIRELKYQEQFVVAVVRDVITYNILTKADNFDKILLELRQINDTIQLRFVLKEYATNKIEKNIVILKKLFGSNIDIV